MEAKERSQRERVIRLNRYSQGRKDQNTIKRLRAAMSGKGTEMPSVGEADKRRNTSDHSAAHVGASDNMVFRSLDPSMFKYVASSRLKCTACELAWRLLCFATRPPYSFSHHQTYY